MPMIAHVFRRGAVCAWRRRVPVRSGNATKAGFIQVSLYAHDPATARVIGVALHATSERAFELMAASRLTAEQARTWLEHVVKKELDAIDNRRLAEHDDISGGGYEDNRLLDELAAHCFRLLASQGKSAAFDPSRDKALAARGFSEEEIERGGYLLDIYKRDFWSDARHGKTVREAGRVLGQDEISSLVYMELRRIQMEGKSVALSASLNPDDDRLGDAIAAASKVIEARESARRNIFADGTAAAPQGQDAALGGATPEPEAISVKQVEPFVFQGSSYSDDITDVIDRLKAIKKREGFRPFAPTVLAEHAAEWFPEVTPSPAMSLTRPAKGADSWTHAPKPPFVPRKRFHPASPPKYAAQAANGLPFPRSQSHRGR